MMNQHIDTVSITKTNEFIFLKQFQTILLIPCHIQFHNTFFPRQLLFSLVIT